MEQNCHMLHVISSSLHAIEIPVRRNNSLGRTEYRVLRFKGIGAGLDFIQASKEGYRSRTSWAVTSSGH